MPGVMLAVALMRIRRRPGAAAGTRIRLRPDETWAATLGRGRRIECCAGVVWLTHAGRDHVLRAGGAFTAGRRGRTVVLALTDAMLNFT